MSMEAVLALLGELSEELNHLGRPPAPRLKEEAPDITPRILRTSVSAGGGGHPFFLPPCTFPLHSYSASVR